MNAKERTVRLRAIEPEDLDVLYGIENDMTLWNTGVTNVPYSRYILHDYVANNKFDIYADRQVRLIVENEGSKTVGIADITEFSPKHHRAETGIVIMTAERGKGYATAALAELCRYARKELNMHQLYAIIAQNNCQAQKAYRKAGFKETAVLKEWLLEEGKYLDAVMMQIFF